MTMSEIREAASRFLAYYACISVVLSILVGFLKLTPRTSFILGLIFGNSIGMLAMVAIDPYDTSTIVLVGGILSFYFTASQLHAHIKYPSGKVKQYDDLSEGDIL